MFICIFTFTFIRFHIYSFLFRNNQLTIHICIHIHSFSHSFLFVTNYPFIFIFTFTFIHFHIHSCTLRYNQLHYAEVFSDEKDRHSLIESETQNSLLDCLERWLERTPGIDQGERWGQIKV